MAWADEATRGKFGLGDDSAGLTWEEDNLIKKLAAACGEYDTGNDGHAAKPKYKAKG